MAKGAFTEGVYSATYSGVPVYEFQFGTDLKEHVMRRRQDDWINATHILKAAGFDKPARTRILEREVQKDTHEKIQGGYGKYQGTWIPLGQGEALAQRNNIYERLRPIFEYTPGDQSPPPAPRHASKPKAPKKPAVPKWGTKAAVAAQERKNSIQLQQQQQQQLQQLQQQQNVFAHPQQVAPIHDDYDATDSQMHEDDAPDNVTVASASYMAEDDRVYDMSQFSTGHRKRKRDEVMQDMTEQQHAMYGDELLDYFLLSQSEQAAIRPDPPTNFQPDWPIDTAQHTSIHWASAMGDVDVIKQLKRFGANLLVQNVRGETPLMRAVSFTNCFVRKTFPIVLKELFSSVDARDHSGCTVIHHAAIMKSGRVTSTSCARYYLENIISRLKETRPPNEVQALLDAQDGEGNTALHLAAKLNARKCIRTLLGHDASSDIPNNEGIRAEDIIKELNQSRSVAAHEAPVRSSSPFAPDSQKRHAFRDAIIPDASNRSFHSEAANTVQSRVAPLVLQKLQDLSASYEAEYNEKDDAEKEARRILANTEAELNALRASVAELESRLEPDDTASKTQSAAEDARAKVLAYVTHQNRIAVQEAIDQELAKSQKSQQTNGVKHDDQNSNDENSDDHDDTNSIEERLDLAAQIQQLLNEQREAEVQYVEARGMLGTGDKIDKYRHLLRSCLPPEEQETLDENLDDLIRMMEDEDEVNVVLNGVVGSVVGVAEADGVVVPEHSNHHHGGGGGEPMEITAL
ncbi:cell division cycle-related protein res2/pct1 [Podospora fimiseda]|uniref:Cell division cycle-related protein res2/pct1 n=1 Tax=Podospora fimiseda TaxID=252190 RepID=A0AAN7BLT5_9PEZI|nr:cell division cycle-related protein res2/pct1 [Podospora fimiseda]